MLEVGCGSGAFWEANGDRVDPTWRLTLTDFSPGMVEAAQRVLGGRAQLLVADVQELPFPDESFDVVLANHMLYHVPDRPRAFAEIARVLVTGGSGVAELEAFFVDVTCERYDNALAVTDAEAAVAYVASSETFHDDLGRVRRAVEEAIARDGVFRIDSDAGLLHARKP